MAGANGAGVPILRRDDPPSGVVNTTAECECGTKTSVKVPVVDILSRKPMVVICVGCGKRWGQRFKIGVDVVALDEQGGEG